MAVNTSKTKVHPSRRHNNPLLYKSGKPRLRVLNPVQLANLLDKTQRNREKAKIVREIKRKNTIHIKKHHPELLDKQNPKNQALDKLAKFNQENNLTY